MAWPIIATIAASKFADLAFNSAEKAAEGGINQAYAGISSARQWKYQQKMMRLQQKYALAQMARSYEYQRRMFDYENEYNSPVNVFQRYRDAGINPSGVLGSGGANVQSTIPASSAPSGGSGPSGGAPVPSGLLPSQGGLATSQIVKNLAEADRADAASELDRASVPTQAWIQKDLESRVGVQSAQSALLGTQKAYQEIVNAHEDEMRVETINNLRMAYGKMLTEAGLNDAEAKYYAKAATNQAAQALTQGALKGYYEALKIKVGNEVRILGLEYEDLKANLDSLAREQTCFFYRLNEKGEKEPVTYTLSMRDARFMSSMYQMVQAANDAFTGSIDADWISAEKGSDMTLQWLDAIAAITSMIMSRGMNYQRMGEIERHNREMENQGRSSTDEFWGPDGDFQGGRTTTRGSR